MKEDLPILTSYRYWLKSKSYSDATIRNYLVDLKKYFLFTNSVRVDRCVDPSLGVSDKIFDPDNLTSYFQNINQDPNYKRFLASLSKFFQFALDQRLISINPFNKAIKAEPKINSEEIIKLYQQQLETKKLSLSTIRNYINDIHQYLHWIKSTPTPPLTKGGVINNSVSLLSKGETPSSSRGEGF